jgi:hypothetical protein
MSNLKVTMEEVRHDYWENIGGVTFFSFTDNVVTCCCILKSGSSVSLVLHEMVEEIKRIIEIELLDIALQMVHVPAGTTIIVNKGTDGLSRGIWIFYLHSMPYQDQVILEMFAPVPFTLDVTTWALKHLVFFTLSHAITGHGN